eukprot:tig00000718_g3709.t1
MAFILSAPASAAQRAAPVSAATGSSSLLQSIQHRPARAASQFGGRNTVARTFDVQEQVSFSVDCNAYNVNMANRAALSKKVDYHHPADIRQGYDPEDPHPAFTQVINELYPDAVSSQDFLRQTYKALLKLGFSKVNTLPCATLCRDEICRPLGKDIEDLFCRTDEDEANGKFILNALAGIMSSGRTAVKAAVSHAPMMDGYERYLFMSFPHIAIDYRGRVGMVRRPGRSENSHACGALLGLEDAFATGALQTQPAIDPADLEMSMLKRRFFNLVPRGSKPNLVEITDMALQLAEETLDNVVPEVVSSRRCHYAVVTGIQIHGPDGTNFIAPSRMYAVIHGKRQEINVDFTPFAVTKAGKTSTTPAGLGSALEAASAAFDAASRALVVASKEKNLTPRKKAPAAKARTPVNGAAPKKKATSSRKKKDNYGTYSPTPSSVSPASMSTSPLPYTPTPTPTPVPSPATYSPTPAAGGQVSYGIASPPAGYEPQYSDYSYDAAETTYADAAPSGSSSGYSIASPPAGYVPQYDDQYGYDQGYSYDQGYAYDGSAQAPAYYDEPASSGSYSISAPPAGY